MTAAEALLAADAAFYLVFGVFAVAFVALCIITMGWAVRQDRSGREKWLQRQARRRGADDGGPDGAPGAGPPSANGRGPSRHRPKPSRRPPG